MTESPSMNRREDRENGTSCAVPVGTTTCDRAVLQVLFISPSTKDYSRLADALRGPTWKLRWVQDLRSATKALDTSAADVVICDARATGELAPMFQVLLAHRTAPRVIAACPEQKSALWAEVLNLGARDAVALPFETPEVLNVLRTAWYARRATGRVSAATA